MSGHVADKTHECSLTYLRRYHHRKVNADNIPSSRFDSLGSQVSALVSVISVTQDLNMNTALYGRDQASSREKSYQY